MAEAWQVLVELIIRKNAVKRTVLQDAIVRHRAKGDTIERVLVGQGLLTRRQLLELKHEAFGVETVELDPTTVDIEVGRLLPQTMGERYGIVCIGRRGNLLDVVAREALDAIAIDNIRMRVGFDLNVRLGYAGDIEDSLRLVYRADSDEASAPAAVARRPVEPALSTLNVVHEVVAEGVPAERRKIALGGGGAVAQSAAAAMPAPRVVSAPVAAPSSNADASSGLASTSSLPAYAAARTKRVTVVPPPAPPRSTAPSMRRACPQCATTVGVARDPAATRVEEILHGVLSATDSEAASLLVSEFDGGNLFFRAAAGRCASSIVNMLVPLNEASVAGQVVASRMPALVNDAQSNAVHNKATDRMLNFSTVRLAAVPVMWGDRLLGVMEAVNKREADFDDDDLEIMAVAAAQAAVLLNAERTATQLSESVMETVQVMAALAGTSTHDRRVEVTQFAIAMGREMGMDDAALETLSYAGVLHDCEPRLAGLSAHDLLMRLSQLRAVAPIVYDHHERWDGSGPRNLAGESIPLPSRILAVARAWYEGARDLGAFLPRFGVDFDPKLEGIFLSAIRERQRAAEV